MFSYMAMASLPSAVQSSFQRHDDCGALIILFFSTKLGAISIGDKSFS